MVGWTNVAVDRVLLGVQQRGCEDFVRVGSVRRWVYICVFMFVYVCVCVCVDTDMCGFRVRVCSVRRWVISNLCVTYGFYVYIHKWM
jgi:hypothetical protein